MSWIYCPVSGKLPTPRVYHAAAPILSTNPLSPTYNPQDESRILLFGGATVSNPNPLLNSPSNSAPATSLSTISRASLDLSQLSSHTNAMAALHHPSPPSSSPELSHHIPDDHSEDSSDEPHSQSASAFASGGASQANDNSKEFAANQLTGESNEIQISRESSASANGNVPKKGVCVPMKDVAFEYLSDTWIMDNSQAKWQEIAPAGEVPSKRGMHTLTSIPSEKYVVLIGGFDGTNYFNDVYVFNYETMMWSKPAMKGPGPQPRGGHATAAVTGKLGTTLVVFGGKNHEQYFNDVYFLDIKNLDKNKVEWMKPHTSGDPPTQRAFASVAVSEDTKKIFVFGGEMWYASMGFGDAFNDLFILNPSGMKWEKPTLSPTSIIPTPRYGHSMIYYNNHLIVYGGTYRKTDSEPMKGVLETSVFLYDVENSRWIKKFLRAAISGIEPPRCYHHSATILHGVKIYIWGGIRMKVRYTQDEGYTVNKSLSNNLVIVYHLDHITDSSVEAPLTPRSKSGASRASSDSKGITKGVSKLKFMLAEASSSNNNVNKEVKDKEKDKEQLGIGRPYNFRKGAHVDLNFNWQGDPNEMFDLERELGSGSYGTVYKGRHKETGFNVAIKAININTPDKASDIMSNKVKGNVTILNTGLSEELKKEIEILKKCRHSNVVSYFGTCSTKNQIWILMDYCQFGSIRDLFETSNETLNEDEVAFVCSQTLRGLIYLHAMKIIHRDVKAANILVNEDGQVKIADFGVSDTIGKADDSIGTPLWMAPEVINRAPYDAKCDIWSLGITTIEMADGLPPLHNMKPKRAMVMVPLKPPPTVKEPSRWSRDFNDFVASCLVKDPAKRGTAIDLMTHAFITKAKGSEVLKPRLKLVAKLMEEKQKEKENQNRRSVPAPLDAAKIAEMKEDASPPLPSHKKSNSRTKFKEVMMELTDKAQGLARKKPEAEPEVETSSFLHRQAQQQRDKRKSLEVRMFQQHQKDEQEMLRKRGNSFGTAEEQKRKDKKHFDEDEKPKSKSSRHLKKSEDDEDAFGTSVVKEEEEEKASKKEKKKHKHHKKKEPEAEEDIFGTSVVNEDAPDVKPRKIKKSSSKSRAKEAAEEDENEDIFGTSVVNEDAPDVKPRKLDKKSSSKKKKEEDEEEDIFGTSVVHEETQNPKSILVKRSKDDGELLKNGEKKSTKQRLKKSVSSFAVSSVQDKEKKKKPASDDEDDDIFGTSVVHEETPKEPSSSAFRKLKKSLSSEKSKKTAETTGIDPKTIEQLIQTTVSASVELSLDSFKLDILQYIKNTNNNNLLVNTTETDQELRDFISQNLAIAPRNTLIQLAQLIKREREGPL